MTSPGARPAFAWVPTGRLRADPRYQREMNSDRSRRLVRQIAEGFRWSAFGAVQVAVEPGDLDAFLAGRGFGDIFDGQHRTAGARMAGEPDVPCMVYGMALAERAAAFVRTNGARVAVNIFQVHHAAVAAGDEAALDVDRACRAAGVTIARNPIPYAQLPAGHTLALRTIARMVRSLGVPSAANAMRSIVAGWGGRSAEMRASLLQAVADLAASTPPERRPALYAAVTAALRSTEPAAFWSAATIRRLEASTSESRAIASVLRQRLGGSAT